MSTRVVGRASIWGQIGRLQGVTALTLSLWMGALAQAQDQSSIRSLLDLPERPNAQNFLRFADRFPRGTDLFAEFGDGALVNYRALNSAYANAPELIAYLERAFPNAVYAPLGRDASSTALLLDAFYTSVGMLGRVSPIRASGPTVKSATAPQLFELLRNAGLDIQAQSLATLRPFLILDRTRYNEVGDVSQAGRFLRIAYEYFRGRGFLSTDLFSKISVVHLQPSPSEMNFAWTNFKQPEDFFAELHERWLREPRDAFRGLPPAAVTAPMRTVVGALVDGPEWHKGYGPLNQMPDGHWEPEYRGHALESTRASMLAQEWAVIQMVRSPQFLESVTRRMERLGATPRWPVPIAAVPVDIRGQLRSIERGLNQIVDGLRSIIDAPQHTSLGNYALLNASYDYFSPPYWDEKGQVATRTFDALLRAYSTRKVAREHYRNLMVIYSGELVARYGQLPEGVFQYLRFQAQQNPIVRELLTRESEHFSNGKLQNVEQTKAAYAQFEQYVLAPLGLRCGRMLEPDTK